MPAKQCRHREGTTDSPPDQNRGDPSPTMTRPPQSSDLMEQPEEARRQYDDEGEYIPPPKVKTHLKSALSSKQTVLVLVR